MSADRWSVCPRCTAKLSDDIEAKQGALDASYGAVPLETFDEMRAEVEAARARLASEGHERLTFREDYEFYGLAEGLVTADYSGSCKDCGLSVTFSHAHPFEVRP